MSVCSSRLKAALKTLSSVIVTDSPRTRIKVDMYGVSTKKPLPCGDLPILDCSVILEINIHCISVVIHEDFLLRNCTLRCQLYDTCICFKYLWNFILSLLEENRKLFVINHLFIVAQRSCLRWYLQPVVKSR